MFVGKKCDVFLDEIPWLPWLQWNQETWQHFILVGGFNPFEKYSSKWESSPIFGVKIKNIWNHHLVLDGSCLPVTVPLHLEVLGSFQSWNFSIETVAVNKFQDPHVCEASSITCEDQKKHENCCFPTKTHQWKWENFMKLPKSPCFFLTNNLKKKKNKQTNKQTNNKPSKSTSCRLLGLRGLCGGGSGASFGLPQQRPG